MKKVLMVLGVVFLCLIGGCTVLLIWAQRSGSAHQQKFFTAVLSGDPKKVMALCHPAMKEEVDAPVLGAWMAVVKANLGEFKGLSKTDFNTSTDYKNGHWITESKGTVNFEKGQAQAELRFINGKIVFFHVTSDKIPVAWFKGPVGTELYKRLKREGRLLEEYSGNNVIDDTNIVTRMDRETLRSNYRALVKALYGPKNYYDRVKIFLAEYKEPKEKPPLTADAVLAVVRCFFWLGLIRKGRKDFWRVFCWLCLHKHESLQNFLGLAILGYHFRRVAKSLKAPSSRKS